MKKSITFLNIILLSISFFVVEIPVNYSQNLGFENGNFNNWTGSWGRNEQIRSWFNCKKTGITNPSSGINTSGYHNLVQPGFDPIVGGNIMATVLEGNFALRLGSPSLNSKQIQRISRTYTVPSSDPSITFNYAMVMFDPGGDHNRCTKPYFEIRISRLNGGTVYQNTIIADRTDPYFQTVGNMVYKNWDCELIDLSAHIGRTLRIDFTTANCSQGNAGHYCYAYIDEINENPIEPQFSLNKNTFCRGESILADGTATTNEIDFLWSIEESDENGGRPNPDSERSRWINAQQAGTIDLNSYYASFGETFKCNQYYRIKLAVRNNCISWKETPPQLIKINCPIADAGPDVCCSETSGNPVIGTNDSNPDYTYSWSPSEGLANPSAALTQVFCSNPFSATGQEFHEYPSRTGDFNNDGLGDISFIGKNWVNQSGGLFVGTVFSSGDGHFNGFQFKSGDGSGVFKYPALTGDFNGDGKTDIVFIGQNWSGGRTGLHIRTKFSDGNGQFTGHQFKAGDNASVHTYPALTGDFDGDGKTDIVFVGQDWTGRRTGLHIRSKLSNGDGSYTHYQFKTGDDPIIHTNPALTGDFNGDGKTDIAFVGQNWTRLNKGLHIRIKMSRSGGRFMSYEYKTKDNADVHKYPALTGDFNGDGKTDIVFFDKSRAASIGRGTSRGGGGLLIKTKFSKGDGTFTDKHFRSGESEKIHEYPALTGDFNGDGKTDIAFVVRDWTGRGTGLHILTKFSRGDGTFTNKMFKAGDGSGVFKYPALTGDFNGDGKTDIAFVGQDWTGLGTGLHVRTKFSNGNGTYIGAQASFKKKSTQTYTLTVTENGCVSTDEVTVYNNRPEIELSYEKLDCCTYRINLEASEMAGNTWSTGASNVSSIVVSESGTYMVTAYNACGGVTKSITIDDSSLDSYWKNLNQTHNQGIYRSSTSNVNSLDAFHIGHVEDPLPNPGVYYATSYKLGIYDGGGDIFHTIERDIPDCDGFEENSIQWDGKINGHQVMSGFYEGRLYIKNCRHGDWKPVRVEYCKTRKNECLEYDCIVWLGAFECGFFKKKTCIRWIPKCEETTRDFVFPIHIQF